jgi:glycosyltransferase involved in cell wall biosynthesis
MNPRVSICIPAYNGEFWIADAIRSVLRQTIADWELIISDDASTDGTRNVVQAFVESDYRIKYQQQDIRLGAGNNWNSVLSLATSNFVKLMGQDDVLYPDCLELSLPAIEEDSKIDLVVGRRDIIDGKGNVIFRGRGLNGLEGTEPGQHAFRQTILKGSNILGEPSFSIFRRSKLLDVGGFDLRWNYLIDIASYASAVGDGYLHCVDSTLGAFRVSSGSWSSELAKVQAREFRTFSQYLFEKKSYKISKMDLLRSMITISFKTWLRRLVMIYLNRVK